MFEEENNKEVLEDNPIETEPEITEERTIEEAAIGEAMEDDDETEEKPDCKNCGGCCNHIAIELDKPKDIDEYTEIIWYLMHKNIMVGIDHEDDWYIEFKAECKARIDNKCAIYDSRPHICKEYESEECELHGEGSAWKHEWHSREDFLDYLKEHNPEIYEKIINSENYNKPKNI